MLFNKKPVDAMNQHMFFGESVNVSRYDQQKFPVFEKLIEKQLSFFWRPDEVNITEDARQYQKLDDHEKHIFNSNLKYQTLLDSVQGRGPNLALLPIVSLPELETWIETWCFSECLAEGTEVLTDKGWRDLSVVTTSDSCLVYDLDSECVFFENPKRVVEYDLDTDLVHYKSKNGKQFDQLVTPNHRMPVIHRDIKDDGTRTKYFKEAVIHDYKPNHLAPVSGRLLSKNTRNLTPLERLLIATQADGSVSGRYNGGRCGTIPVWFNLTKQRKIDELKRIVEDCGFDMAHLTDDKRDLSKRFKVSVPIDLIENINVKTFSWVDLSSISFEWAIQFMDELSKWDSHIQNDSSFTYSTVVRENADMVQSIAAMCDKSPRMVVRNDDRKETYKDLYSINIIDRNFKDGQSISKEYVKYKGKVRCLETSTGAFIIRYNGVVSVTGNTIHSRSYTHILRNLVPNPSKFFDSIMIDDNIIKRAEAVTKYGDDLIDKVQSNREQVSLREVKKSLYLYIMSTNILEAVRFYVSFACSFAFAERTLMEGNAKIIKLIARDEALHLSGTQHMINIMRTGRDDPEMALIAEECKSECSQMFVDAVNQEKEWANYLFKDGSMVGLNEQILGQYVEYIANIRMQAVGLDDVFSIDKNPIPWINSWLSSEANQVAPQEAEISSYLVGQIDNTMNDNEFDDFDMGDDL